MQPFGIPKNPKMTVQTKKQPPVQRYPVPYGVTAKPNLPTSLNGPFEEDNTKAPFETPPQFRPSNGFDESEGPLQTPEGIGAFGKQNQGESF